MITQELHLLQPPCPHRGWGMDGSAVCV